MERTKNKQGGHEGEKLDEYLEYEVVVRQV